MPHTLNKSCIVGTLILTLIILTEHIIVLDAHGIVGFLCKGCPKAARVKRLAKCLAIKR